MISTPHGIQASTLWLAFLLALAICAINCKPPVFAPLREDDRREVARKIENAIEATGRSQVWIKSPVGLTSGKPETPVEARVGAEVYSTVMAALQHEAEKNHLECALNESRTKEGWRVADIRLLRSGKQVSR